MTDKEAEMLIALITKLVESSGKTWGEKKAFICSNAGVDEMTNINEFASWFDG